MLTIIIKKRKKNKFWQSSGIVVLILATLLIAYAAFADRGSILGSSFSVGSADLKLLADLSAGVSSENLVDELTGPTFSGINPNWQIDYLVKLYNNGTSKVHLSTNSNYETINDPEDLRQIIFVEPIEWNDANNNGLVDTGEEGVSLGEKTIVKWKTEGYDLGELESGAIKPLILRFSTDTISDTKQGASAIFDFLFDSVEVATP